MQLLLLHGMGRTPLSMRRLARSLRRSGHRVEALGYLSAIESFDRIVGRVQRRLAALTAQGTCVAIGHSLGGLLVRLAVAGAPAPQPAHLIMLGTPNQPPRQAARYGRLWPYRWINGECGQLLARADFFDRLPPLTIPYTIIAGTGGRCGGRSPFGDNPNDGLVAVSETLVSPADQPVTLPVRHTFMMNDRQVRAAIREVLGRVP